MIMSNNDLQKAEKAVTTVEAAVAQAQAVVADLEAKRGDAVRHGTDLQDERTAIAFQAHTGDDKAAQRLKEIHQAISEHSSELASLDAAIRAASTKVETAKAALAVEMQKVDALKLRAASRAFFAHMRKLDKALDELVNVLYDVEPIRQQLDALGVGPSYDQFRVLGERPMLLALEDTI
jgi:chromosome segregation ATPase